MKTSNFLWAYNCAQLRTDPKQTRDNFAKMLRAWRRLKGYTVCREILPDGVMYTVKVGQLSARQLILKGA